MVGNLSSSNGVQSINIHHLRQITSFDEVTHHFLSVVVAHLYYKKRAEVPMFLE